MQTDLDGRTMTTTEVRNEYVRLSNGALAHFTAAGDRGPAVILLHGGLPGSSGSAGWSKLVPELARRGARVYAPDLPGFGRSDTRKEHYPHLGLKSWVDFVREFANAMGLDQFYIGGNSQGAQISALFTANHFDRIQGLFLISTAGLSECLQISWPFRERGDWPPRFEGSENSMREILEHVIRAKDNITDDLVIQRTRAAGLQANSYAAGVASRRGVAGQDFLQWMDLSNRLCRMEIPMIYLHGINDRLLPLEGVQLQEDALPNAQFFYLENCGHQAQTDQPEIVNQLISEFVLNNKISLKLAQQAGISTRRPPLTSLVGDTTAYEPAV